MIIFKLNFTGSLEILEDPRTVTSSGQVVVDNILRERVELDNDGIGSLKLCLNTLEEAVDSEKIRGTFFENYNIRPVSTYFPFSHSL